MANLFPDHADLYHTGIVVHDLERAKAELSEQLGITWGVQLAARVGTGEPGGQAPIVMHRAASGLYVELVDRSLREVLFGA
jgi:hypothetical protein